MRRIIVMVALLFVVAGSFTFSSTKPAFAHSASTVRPLTVTCSGDGCDNADPNVTGCSDSTAVTVKEMQITGAAGTSDAGTIADVELRYSSTCGTNWTRFTSFIDNAKTVATIERLQQTGISYLKYCSPTSCYASNDGGSTVNYSIYTNMVYAPVAVAKACGTIVSQTTGRTYKACVQN